MLVLLCLAGCGAGGDEDGSAGTGGDGEVLIVATTSIWGDVVSRVACDERATVDTMIPRGADPHGFEPSLADRGRLESASLVVANGLGLEEGLLDTLDAVEAGGVSVVRVGDEVDTIPYGGAATDDHGPEDHGEADPHLWMDPTRVVAVLPTLGDGLIDAGLDAEAVEGCVEGYGEELAGLDAEIADLVAGLDPARRQLVTNHDALGYFADRYGFEVIGTILPAPSGLAETNAAHLEELVTLLDASGVPAVFAETQRSTDDAEALARRLEGVEVVTLATGSLGEAGSATDTYTGLLRTNAAAIVEALR